MAREWQSQDSPRWSGALSWFPTSTVRVIIFLMIPCECPLCVLCCLWLVGGLHQALYEVGWIVLPHSCNSLWSWTTKLFWASRALVSGSQPRANWTNTISPFWAVPLVIRPSVCMPDASSLDESPPQATGQRPLCVTMMALGRPQDKSILAVDTKLVPALNFWRHSPSLDLLDHLLSAAAASWNYVPERLWAGLCSARPSCFRLW